MRLTTLGDLLLDVIVRLDGSLVIGDDQMAHTEMRPGGQAANVAAWAAELGAATRLVGRRGADATGDLLARELGDRRVEVLRAGRRPDRRRRLARRGRRPHDGLRPWRLARAVGAGPRARMVRLRRAPRLGLCAPARTDRLRRARPAHGSRREHGAQISVDASTWTLVDDDFRTRLRALEPDLVFATEPEQAAIGRLDTRWILKRGPRGLTVDGRDYPAVEVDVVDTTGAGDALAAGFLVGGPELGVATAARCCAQLGAMP